MGMQVKNPKQINKHFLVQNYLSLEALNIKIIINFEIPN